MVICHVRFGLNSTAILLRLEHRSTPIRLQFDRATTIRRLYVTSVWEDCASWSAAPVVLHHEVAHRRRKRGVCMGCDQWLK